MTGASVRVTRSRLPTYWTGLVVVAIVIGLALLPAFVDPSVTDTLINALILLTMACMWNLLAGYAGLVSVGQQAFIGFGAYIVLILAQNGFDPFLTIPLAAIGCAILAVPISWLVFRLRGGYFAIATWVVADACQLMISRVPSLGGGTGATLPGIAGRDPRTLTTMTYWVALAVAVAAFAAGYFLLRSRIGLVLTAVRDNEAGASSLGAQVAGTKRIVYLVAAAGAGGAGALLIISQLNVQANSVFSVSWSADMIFITIIGGIGSIEGPIVGTIVYMLLEQTLAQYGAGYLIVVGVVAVVVALWAPRGLWGVISGRIGLRPFPVGYWLWPPTPRGQPAAPAKPASTRPD